MHAATCGRLIQHRQNASASQSPRRKFVCDPERHRWYDCRRRRQSGDVIVSNIIWIVLIGFLAGIVARFLSRGPNNPTGFFLTTVLGIAGAFVATLIGQQVGWYRLDQGAGFIGATVGALVVLLVWNRLVAHRIISDPGVPQGSDGQGPRRWL
jgi:uncharacterized membrane protein YeaQ/YmgE (transglycosylase-associated protein family)